MRFSTTFLAFGLVGPAFAQVVTPPPPLTINAGSSGSFISILDTGGTTAVTVRAAAYPCDDGFTVQFNPTDVELPNGGTTTFEVTVIVPSDVPQGIYTCPIYFTILSQDAIIPIVPFITVTVINLVPSDTTAPTVSCVAGTNPAAKKPGDGANFKTLIANDDVDVDTELMIRVLDSVSSTDLGLYRSGTTIKLVQASDGKPRVKPGTGEVNWQITVKECALLVVVDMAGNAASTTCCPTP